MAKKLQLRGGTTVQHSTFTGALREVTVDTTKDTVVVHDGSTAGGIPLATEANAANKLPLAGGTMTGDVSLGDNVKATFGAGDDLQIYHNGTDSYIADTATGSAIVSASRFLVKNAANNERMIDATENASVILLYDNGEKLATTSTGIDVTGRAVVDSSNCVTVVDNDGSFNMNGGNNFKCTPTGAITLTFTNITNGQSGFILLVNSGQTVSAASTTKVDANLLATVTAAGTYLVSYFSDGTNVYLTNSAVYA